MGRSSSSAAAVAAGAAAKGGGSAALRLASNLSFAIATIEISSSQGRTRRRANLYLAQDSLERWGDNATGQLCTCDAHQAACGRAIAEGRSSKSKSLRRPSRPRDRRERT